MKPLLTALVLLLSLSQLFAQHPYIERIDGHVYWQSNWGELESTYYLNFHCYDGAWVEIVFKDDFDYQFDKFGDVDVYASPGRMELFFLGQSSWSEIFVYDPEGSPMVRFEGHSMPAWITSTELKTNSDNEVVICAPNDDAYLMTKHELDNGDGYDDDGVISFGSGHSGGLVVNATDTIKSSEDFDIQTLQDGDLIQVYTLDGFQSGNCPGLQDSYYSKADTLWSQIATVRKVPNPVTKIIAPENGQYTICPGDSIILRVYNSSTTGTYYWHNASYWYKADTLVVTKPGEYYTYRNTYPCMSMSNIVEITHDTTCNNYYYGRVVNTYDGYTPIANIRIATNTGRVLQTNDSGWFFIDYPFSEKIEWAEVAEPGYYPSKRNVPDGFVASSGNTFYTYKIQEHDLVVYLNSGRNRPGFTIPYYVTVRNDGREIDTTDIEITLAPELTYKVVEGEDAPDEIVGNTLRWKDVIVDVDESIRKKVFAVLDVTTPLASFINSKAEITLLDSFPFNNIAEPDFEVTGSYDPNDKLVTWDGLDTHGFVYDTTVFEYTIRFQNTGNDTAFTVRVTDVIDEDFDLSSITMLDASHDYSMRFHGDTVEWIFNNILLVDSTTNEPLSHGFIRFRIEQEQTTTTGTELTNQAYIYFDFNAPIITNETVNIVDNGIVTALKSKTNNSTRQGWFTCSNPFSESLKYQSQSSFTVFNVLGNVVASRPPGKGRIDTKRWTPGIYLVVNDENNHCKKIIKR